MAAKVWVTRDLDGVFEIFFGNRPSYENNLDRCGFFSDGESHCIVCAKDAAQLGLDLKPGECRRYEVAFTPVKARKGKVKS